MNASAIKQFGVSDKAIEKWAKLYGTEKPHADIGQSKLPVSDSAAERSRISNPFGATVLRLCVFRFATAALVRAARVELARSFLRWLLGPSVFSFHHARLCSGLSRSPTRANLEGFLC
jgi:hypothetical protein